MCTTYSKKFETIFDELNNRTCICCFILIMDEKEETFLEIFKVLREEPYHMNPLYMMSDFSLGQIKAVKKIYPNALYNGCFFHWSQCIWKKIQYYGLGGKGTYKTNMTILFNLQLLCFIPRNKVNNLFKKIRKKLDINDNTNKLFNYFNKYWLGKRYPIKLWNYYDRLHNASNNSLSKYITTNNLNENINKFLNLNLKGGRNSFENFKDSIENVYIQFEEKLANKHIDDTKTKILNFYVDKINEESNFNYSVLSYEAIDSLLDLYKNDGFENVNGPYNEEQIGDIDLERLPYDSEPDEDGEYSSSEEYLELDEHYAYVYSI